MRSSMPRAEYRCFVHCEGEVYPLEAAKYRCDNCGELLDVDYQYESLEGLDGDGWRERGRK